LIQSRNSKGAACRAPAFDVIIHTWLKEQVGPAYDALQSDPSRAIGIEEIRAKLATRHAKASENR
jgi:hypothetical protein